MSPRFSIILPTRNRAHLLEHSLRTALAQDHDDFEVIVSNNASTDHTREVLESFDDPRLKKIHLDDGLAMPAHWDFILEQAEGDFVRLLCDDDGLLPDAMSSAETFFRDHPEFDAVQQSKATYFHPECPPGQEPNSLEIANDVPSGPIEPDRDRCFADMASGLATMEVPTLLNCVARRSALDAIRERAGKVFPYPTPDFGFAALFIKTNHRWAIDPQITWLWGKSRASIGAMSLLGRNKVVEAFIQELGDEAPLHRVPVPSIFPPNYVAFAVRRACEHLGVEYRMDLPQHFVELFIVLEDCEKTLGFSPERKVILDALRKTEPAERERCLAALKKHGARGLTPGDACAYWFERAFQLGRHQLRRFLSTNEALRKVRRKVRDGSLGSDANSIVRGAERGFTNMPEAALEFRAIEEELRHRRSRPEQPTIPSEPARRPESVAG